MIEKGVIISRATLQRILKTLSEYGIITKVRDLRKSNKYNYKALQ